MWLLLHVDITIYGILILLYIEYWYSVDIILHSKKIIMELKLLTIYNCKSPEID